MLRALAVLAPALVALAGSSPLNPSTVSAASLTVTTTADELDGSPGNGQCSLREAIANANNDNDDQADCPSGSGADVITVPGGTYVLDIGATNEDGNLDGDLDITDDLTITGAGTQQTIFDGNDTERVIQVIGVITVNISDLTVANGRALATGACVADSPCGGGILAGAHVGPLSTLNLTRLAIAGNSAPAGGDSRGGGLALHGSGTIAATTISNNSTAFTGGGVQLSFGTITLVNTTVSGNSGPGLAGRPGSTLQVEAFATVHLVNTTIAGNSSDFAIRVFSATATLTNTILANPGATECTAVSSVAPGILTSNGGNVALDGSCNLNAEGDQPNTDPLLGPLADNGGPTPTHALLEGSPAIDAGLLAVCQSDSGPTDQRGVPRIVGVSCDSGAFEVALEADLTLTKTPGSDTAPAGGELTYTLTATNEGSNTATSVTVSDPLPEGAAYVSDTCGAGPPVAGTLTWSIGTLDDGSSASCDVTVTIDPATPSGPLTNTATVGGGLPDPDPANNTASATVTVTKPDLAVTKTGPDAAPPGATVVYTVTVTNEGGATAEDVVLTDEVSGAGIDGIATPAGVECAGVGDGIAECELGSLEPGESVVLHVAVTAPETDGTTGILNEACASTSSPEEITDNNCAEAGTSVIAGAIVPAVPNVGPGNYVPPAGAPPTATPTSEPTEEPTEVPTATATSEPTEGPTATPTAEPTEEPTTAPTATATTEPTVAPTSAEPTATATPIRTAPMPPETGSGGVASGGSGLWLALLGLAAIAFGSGVLALRRSAVRQ